MEWGQVLQLTEEKARKLMNPLTSYHMLLDNQPQLHVTAERKFREPLIGPDELAVKVTWEWSNVNLNAAAEGLRQDMGLPRMPGQVQGVR